jgi:dihydropteroate synthase
VLSRASFNISLPDGRALALGPRTLVMGIVNVTPDSFADGGRRFDPEVAIAAACEMARLGADIIDIGGESTRPGAAPLPAEDELAASSTSRSRSTHTRLKSPNGPSTSGPRSSTT